MSRRLSRGPARRASALSASLLLLCLGATGILVPAGVASAGGSNAFTVSGSLSGTLKLVPGDDCGGSSGGETQLDIVGKLKGSKSDQWNFIVIAPKNGTFTIKAASTGVASSTVTLETPGTTEALSWDATKGSITVDGSSGSLNVTLKGTTGGASGTVKIKGRWACPS